MARIDRLPDRAKRLLQTAAVLGREFPLRLLPAIWDDKEDVRVPLRELIRREFLYKQTGLDTTCVFTHALTQEVAYDSLITSRRRQLHAVAGSVLEKLYSNRLAEVYDRLAYHYSKAEQASKAIEYLTHSARKAARGHSHTEAVMALKEALTHAEKLPTGESDSYILDLVLRQVQSLNFLGRNRESLDLLLRQQDRIRQLNDPARSARFYFSLGVGYGLLGDQQRAAESLSRSINEAQRCGDERTLGRAFALQTLQSHWSGHGREGIECGRQAVTYLTRTQQRYWLGLAHFYIATVYYMMGELEAALASLDEAKAIGETLRHSGIRSFAQCLAGLLLVLLRESDAGIAECNQALQLSPDPLTTGIATGVLGHALLERADAATAIPYFEKATLAMRKFGYNQNYGWFTVGLAESYLLTGNLEKARELALHGLTITRQANFSLGSGLACRALGRIARRTGDLSEAETYFAQTLKTLSPIPARFELARTHVDVALLASLQKETNLAAAHYQEAVRTFSALNLKCHVEHAKHLAAESGMTLSEQSGGLKTG
jgi:tetratricopeptide (TPR) repeat protein